MYISGTQYNLENRLHQLPDTSGDLHSFWSEYISYNISGIFSGKLDREFEKKFYEVNPIYFGLTGISGSNINYGASYVRGILT